ncbi:DNA repair protein RecN [Ferruginibacter lapsinanis]|uniref:DNA repair protein RecN n=1 Tax=Ferruginibacter lapsinanis TaxID=563172 RepID=UPI001E605D5D|nr:DNA repair protein RecN [Ferruginibacter lapsinanis]UEG49797.1 DNA repair protein RecN [Ferruginibacter lapsinanis]
MLTKLHIQNYAIIDEIDIDFSSGLNIITGETGAGKSILIGALSLILGDRAESSTLMNKEKKCVVEGSFKTKARKEIRSFLKENELDLEDDLVVRREIASNGKSRAFINDTPVNLTQLKALSSLLVDLHQQFDTLELGDNDFQREVLDALAGNGELLQQYATFFHQYTAAKKELQELQQQQLTANAALDYNQFLFDELDEAGLKENELEELDAELKLLSNAENVKQQLSAVYFELKESDQPIVQQLKSLSNKLHSLEEYHTMIPDLTKRIQSAQLELQDVADELESIDNAVQYSPERIQIVNDKISVGYKLLKKHGVNTTNELLAIKDSLQEKLNDILNLGDVIIKKEKETKELSHQCETLAASISSNRSKATKPFAEKVNNLLVQVGMPNAQIKVHIEKVSLNIYGIDAIEFLFDANKSNRFEPLRKVASGGELSRLMLCIKSLVAKKLQLPTLIFDEIDTGISGEAAKQVGLIMKDLSSSHQLISITHQPQIAAKATAHYFVYKAIKEDRITTSIRLLNNDERITTIAQMLSGEKPTAAALQNAREMVGN